MTTRTALIVSLVLTAAAGAYYAWAYPALPDRVPSHWNLHGQVDGWSAKSTLAWVMPLLMLGLSAFIAGAQWLSPRGWDVAPFRRTFNLIMVLGVALVGYFWVVSAVVARDPGADSGRLVVAGLLVFLAVIGNSLGKVRKNFWVGIRLPWTLASDRVWVATHRLAARLLTAAGVIGAVATLAGAPMPLVFAGLMAAILIPCVYSFVLYKRQNPPAATAAAAMLAGFALAVAAPARTVEAQPTATEVTFEGVGGLELKGTLLLPEGAGEGQRVPGALLLPGSGPPDRNGNVPPMFVTDLLKQVAERLAAEGIATLRFDKRSAATYAGVWPKDTAEMSEFFAWDHFVGDARAAAAYLRAHEAVDGERVAIVGHSEGGLITLQIAHDTAGTDEAPAAIVLLATAGRRLDDVVRNQIADTLAAQGAPEEVAKGFMDATERAIVQVVRDGTVPGDVPMGLRAIFNPSAAKLLRSYFTIDPTDLAAAYDGPVLLLQGELDSQVLAEKDAPALEAALEARAKGTTETVIVPGTSHNLKAVQKKTDPGFTGPVVPEAMEKIATWLGTQLGAAGGVGGTGESDAEASR